VNQNAAPQTNAAPQNQIPTNPTPAFPPAVQADIARIAKALGVEPWVILAQAAGLRVDQVERFTEGERKWLDVYRALDPEQRETILNVARVMRRPSPRKRTD